MQESTGPGRPVADHAGRGTGKATVKTSGKDVHVSPRTVELRSLFDYWNAKRGERRFILRSQLDPREIAALLPLVFILDVEQEPRRFLIRLMGTGIARRFGGDYTGRYLDELDFGAAKEQVIADYGHVVDRAEPHLAFVAFTQPGRGRIQAERLALPMSTDGLKIDCILGSVIHVPLGARDNPEAYRKAPWSP